jgi:hypothetical protein
MTRLYPKTIRNKAFLSRLLEFYLVSLENSPYQLTLRNLAWDTQIPENVLRRLLNYYRTPEDLHSITTTDFYIAFSNIMIHYPTALMWWDLDGQVFVSV